MKEPVEGCTHQTKHLHGTRGAWRNNCCKCPKCEDGNRTYNRVARAREQGYRPRVGAAYARAHILELELAGMTGRRIAELAGLSADTIYELKSPRRKMVSADVHDMIMAVEFDGSTIRENCVDATGTIRRLRHLGLSGWRASDIAEVTMMDPKHITQVRAGKYEDVTHMTAERVKAGTRILLKRTPPPGRGSALASTHARSSGWLSMFLYEDVDDPTCEPIVEAPTKFTSADDRYADFVDLVEQGTGVEESARRVGYSSIESAYQAAWKRGDEWLTEQVPVRERKVAA